MKQIKKVILICVTTSLSLCISLAYALPFTIVPAPGTTLPKVMGESAFYTVSNNTGTKRERNFVKYLPPNVRQVTDDPSFCGATFTLGPQGSADASCTLKLIVTGLVNANDPDPHHHLFVCFPGGITCAGTKFPINVSVALVGTTGQAGPATNQLFVIDPATGHATFIMQLTSDDGAVIASDGLNLYHWTGFAPLERFERINLDSLTLSNIPFFGSSISEVFGAVFFNNIFLVSDINEEFFTFSINGRVRQIGDTTDEIRGMACFNHQIFAINKNPPQIREINPTNGHTFSSVPVLLPGFIIENGLGLTVNPITGQFYALLSVEGSDIRKLVTIDVNTGWATLIGDVDGGPGGLRFASITFHPANRNC